MEANHLGIGVYSCGFIFVKYKGLSFSMKRCICHFYWSYYEGPKIMAILQQMSKKLSSLGVNILFCFHPFDK